MRATFDEKTLVTLNKILFVTKFNQQKNIHISTQCQYLKQKKSPNLGVWCSIFSFYTRKTDTNVTLIHTTNRNRFVSLVHIVGGCRRSFLSLTVFFLNAFLMTCTFLLLATLFIARETKEQRPRTATYLVHSNRCREIMTTRAPDEVQQACDEEKTILQTSKKQKTKESGMVLLKPRALLQVPDLSSATAKYRSSSRSNNTTESHLRHYATTALDGNNKHNPQPSRLD